MSLTLNDVKSLASNLMDIKGTAEVSSAQWVALVNMACTQVHQILVETMPDYWTTTATFTYPANTESIDLAGASYLNGPIPYKIIGVEALPANAAVSQSNVPVKVMPIPFTDRDKYMYSVDSGLRLTTLTTLPLHYTLAGSANLYLTPVPTAPVILRLHYIPAVPTLTTSDGSTAILSGRAPEHHMAVAYCVAHLLNSKREGANVMATKLWMEAKEAMLHVSNSRQVDEPRHIRQVRRGF